MTKKEYLSQAFYLDKRIQTKERQLEWLRNHATYLNHRISDVPQRTTSQRSALEEAVTRMVALEAEVSRDITQMIQLKQEITVAIKRINSMECETILEMRYLTFLSWEQIATQLGYSQDYIYHLHRRALSLVKVPSS